MSSTVHQENVPAAWEQSIALEVNRFHETSKDRLPRPATRVVLSPWPDRLRVRFDVTSPTLLAANTRRQSGVCTDSCVEFFFEPVPGAGYLNIEINCIGTPLAQFHPTYERDEAVSLDDAAIDSMRIEASLPHEAIFPERRGESTWWVSFDVPYATVAGVVGRAVEEVAGPGLSLRWRGNFYKCGDKTSSPHWASWAPIEQKLDFHVPECFAPIVFDEEGRFVVA
ncbi:MAG: carbohydrate-binding family 9-like protein [Phycisphaeraceae bacterium]